MPGKNHMTEVLHSKQLGHLSLLQQGNLQQLVLLLGGCEDPQLSGEPTCTKHTIVLSAQYIPLTQLWCTPRYLVQF